MSTPTRSGRAAFTSLALLVAAVVTPACGTFGTDPASEASADPAAPGGDTPKAKEVDGTPDASEITEELGVFVAARGRDGNMGDRQNPLLTIQAGIERGKKLGKRVYVCSGTYREALTLSDSIAIIGGLSCDLPTWKAGGAPSRIESPTSPALRAKDITTTTRLEGLDVVAPNASEPSASSIGLLADHAPGLVIVSSKITAGNGAKGVDGASGVQLAPAASVAGLPSVAPFKCVAGSGGGGGVMLGTCSLGVGGWVKPPKGAGSVLGTCVGAPGHDGGAGGAGGAGGLWEPYFDSVGLRYAWRYYQNSSAYANGYGTNQDGAPGGRGQDGSVAAPVGTLSVEGYAPEHGVAGTDGAPGHGGYGGRGSNDGLPSADSAAVKIGDTYVGMGGPSGGAGGCPGLAGAGGTGGGASIAVALIASPIVLDGVTLLAGTGGAGGLGSFGSDPTPGGAAGANASPYAVNAAAPGGRGGLAGVSTNGSNGPSVGVFHSGGAPTVKGATTIKPGSGAPTIDAQSRTDAGITRIIPATPAGITKDILTQ